MDTSLRGRILAPNLDDRTWKDLVDEARALIPKYAPQWTDHNPSDIGMTLIELFAHMVEVLIYRLNRVPEKNYIAFLNLLGITRDPATPARAFLTFTAPTGPILVPRGSQAQTQGREGEPPGIFETDYDLTVLPINLKVAILIGKAVFNKYTNVSNSMTMTPAEGQEITIPAGQAVQLCLGFDHSTALEILLRVGLFRPVLPLDSTTGTAQADVTWAYSTAADEPTAWKDIPLVTDDTAHLQHEGNVRLTIPLDWVAQAPGSWASIFATSLADQVADPYFWIGMRIRNVMPDPIKIGIAYVLFNAASSFNALTIPVPEELGTSNGKAFQVFSLKHFPLFKQSQTDTPYDHLRVEVAGVPWTQVQDFPAGPGNFYRLLPVPGEVRFGNFDAASMKGNGSIPPPGAPVTAVKYRYVAGGGANNVGAGTIQSMRIPIPGITGVVNLFSAFGGSDEESIEETKRRAPEVLRNRYRAVTAEDYEYLAREATTDVDRVRCLEPRAHDKDGPPMSWKAGDPWTFGGIDRSPGNVNLIIVPDLGPGEPQPQPTVDLIREVVRYLDTRRDITARMRVTGPRYLPVHVDVSYTLWQKAINAGVDPSVAKLELENNIEKFLHPIHGGLDQRGWKVGQHVFIADLFKAIMPPEDVGFISSLQVSADTPPYFDPAVVDALERPFGLAVPGASVVLADYELVCYGSKTLTQNPSM